MNAIANAERDAKTRAVRGPDIQRWWNTDACLALVACVAIACICVLALLFPPYIGVANDGRFDRVLSDVGLGRIMESAEDDAYFAYYDRVYRIAHFGNASATSSPALRIIVRAAISLDTFVTHDDLFDMRFLAAIYIAMYIPLLYALIRLLLRGTQKKMLRAAMVAACVLVFSDMRLIERFASLYVQPLELIAYLLILCAMLYPSKRHAHPLMPLCAMLGTLLLLLSNVLTAIGGLSIAVACILMLPLRRNVFYRAVCIFCAAIIVIGSTVAIGGINAQKTKANHYHSMTRGLLLQAKDPERLLARYGIEPRFSILADTYADQDYPLLLLESGRVDAGFLDQYTTLDILLHYLSHPGDSLSMLDNSVRASLASMDTFNGNYEKAAGKPPGTKAALPTLWSQLKARSVFKTSAFLLILFSVLFIQYRVHKKETLGMWEKRRRTYMVKALSLTFAFVLLHISTVFIVSGDTDLIRQGFLLGVSLDIWLLFILSQILRSMHPEKRG